jgi:hypothetical protein
MDSSSAAALDESQPSDPNPLPRSPRGLFFRSPTAEEAAANPGTLTVGTPEVLDGDGSDSGPALSPESDEWSDDDPTSSPASSPEKPAQLLSKQQMRKTARSAVQIGTGMAHTIAARTEAQRKVGLYLADEDDAAAIGDPLADVMYRRGDLVGGKLSPDANDFLRSVFGVVGYLTKQVQKIGLVRQLEAAPGDGVQAFPTEDAAA